MSLFHARLNHSCLTRLSVMGIFLSYLSGCAPTHTPHIVDNIQPRAQLIAQQSHGQLRPQLVILALHAYNKAQQAGFGNNHIFTIIDYSLPSTTTRLWVIDLDTNHIVFQEKVAHGIGSGDLYAQQFSDLVNSRQSSVGMYVTDGQSYTGRHGYSVRLHGLESGFNDQAFKRAIVLHSAPYVSEAYIRDHGYLGRTWGCPAINPAHIHAVVDTVKGGSLLLAYGHDPLWLKRSAFLPRVN